MSYRYHSGGTPDLALATEAEIDDRLGGYVVEDPDDDTPRLVMADYGNGEIWVVSTSPEGLRTMARELEALATAWEHPSQPIGGAV